MSKRTIGIAGCGAMGLPIAQRLLAAGYNVWGFDIRPAHEFGSFAPRMVADPGEFAKTCALVFTVVRDAAESADLLFDEQALLARDGAIEFVAVCSTLSPGQVLALRSRAGDHVRMIDAPMSGAPVAAREGTLSFMLGGSEAEVELIEPLIAVLGRAAHHLGPLGAGMAAKVLNNFVAASSVIAVRKVLNWAPALGLDPAVLRAVMHDSSGQTWFGSGFERIDWARERYAPDGTIGILEKDVSCALDAAADEAGDRFGEAILAALRDLPEAPD